MRAPGKYSLLLVLLSLAAGSYSQPQPFRFERLTVDDDLPDQSVSAILQDHFGFLWLGTRNGLVRYDGYTMTVFQPDPDDPRSIGGRWIYDLYEDAQGDLWVSTADGGLSRFDRTTERFTRYRHDPDDPQSLTTDKVDYITPDGRGHLWLETYLGRMNRIEIATGRITPFRHDPNDPRSLSGDVVSGHFVDRQGVLWVGTKQGLNRFDEASGTFIRYRHDPRDAGLSVRRGARCRGCR